MTSLLSSEDRARVSSVEALARGGADSVDALVALLDDPSWAVRRVVVTALADIGDPAVGPLVQVLTDRRDREGRLAAAVDALVASHGDVDPAMVDLSRNSEPAVVCDAVQVLGRRRLHDAIPRLEELARHPDDNVAVGSIEALGRIGGPATVGPLLAAVESKNFFRTFSAIDALGRTGDVRAVRPLTALLSDPLYAPEAIRALGRTGREAAVAPLAPLLMRPVEAIVRTAALALAELRERYETSFGDDEAITAALPKAVDARRASERVVAALPGVAPSECAAFARVLGWLGDPVAITKLTELACAEDPVGRAANDALRRLGTQATPYLLAALRAGNSAQRLHLLPIVGYVSGGVDDIVACLEDSSSDVRTRACEALARLGDPEAVPALFKLIGDRDGRVSHAAAGAIQSLGSLETRRLALAQARSTDARTRRAALRIISYFGYPEGLEILIEALEDEDEKIREAAIYGLPLIDDPKSGTALLRIAKHEATKTRAAAMRALGQTEAEGSEVVAALLAGLEDDDAWVRYYACQSLGKLRVDDAAADVARRMDDESGQVRVAAVEALAHFRSVEAMDALTRAAHSTDPDIRRAALVGFGIARRIESIHLLREAAAGPDTTTRLVAIGALAEFDAPDVVPALAHAISDPSEAVRSAAIGFLSTRPGSDATAALVDGLANPDIRDRVLDALAVAADQRVEGVLAALEQASSDAAPLLVAALTRMRRPSSHAALAGALHFDNVHARRAAASALATLASPEAKEALAFARTSDPDADVRRICATLSGD